MIDQDEIESFITWVVIPTVAGWGICLFLLIFFT